MKTKQELIDFEQWTVDTFNAGKLKSPVHLSGGNEDQLIEIFKDIKPQDWVFTTYRSHYHALLKGVPEQRLKDWILDNKSIHFMDSEYKVFSSAIVGGTLPIAVGVAMAIKKKSEYNKIKGKLPEQGLVDYVLNGSPHVWCFVGDMTASLGVFHDCVKYALYHTLPITFVVEDNGLSTDTVTAEVWNWKDERYLFGFEGLPGKIYHHNDGNLIYYKYKRVWPHYGTGKFINSIWSDVIKQDDVRNKGF